MPRRLVWAALSVIWIVPTLVGEAYFATGAQWWNPPWSALRNVAMMGAAVWVLSAYLILNGRRWFIFPYSVMGLVWAGVTAYWTIRSGHLWAGIYFLIKTAVWIAHAYWIRLEMGRSYLDSLARWYQGRPKPISGLKCESDGVVLRVCRFDRDGAFLFSEKGTGLIGKSQKQTLKFKYRNREFECSAKKICEDPRLNAAGFSFTDLGLDQKKYLGDFFEVIQGDLYANEDR